MRGNDGLCCGMLVHVWCLKSKIQKSLKRGRGCACKKGSGLCAACGQWETELPLSSGALAGLVGHCPPECLQHGLGTRDGGTGTSGKRQSRGR